MNFIIIHHHHPCVQRPLISRDEVSVSKSRSRDAILERFGLVSVWRKSGKVSVSSQTENRRSRSRPSTSR